MVVRSLGLAITLFLWQSPQHLAADDGSERRAAYRDLVAEYATRIPRPPRRSSGELLFLATDQYTPRGSSLEQSTHRKAFAERLFELARGAAESGEPSLAFNWATEVLAYDPDHPEARRVLGYELVDGQWLTPYAARMSRLGKRWHPRFGWLRREDIFRYEAGERKDGTAWVPAEADAKRHDKLDNGWQIRTDHFLVSTNHSLEAGAELAARLERLYQAWRQVFAGFYLSDREVKGLFAGRRSARRRSKPFHVFCHRDRQQYTEHLKRREPRIGSTLGIYFDKHREAHFFVGKDQHAGTLFHEAVHQIFQESRKAARDVGGLANFWVVEGVAAYFESLQELSDPRLGPYFVLGESERGRLDSARRQVLADGFYLPTRELTRLGKVGLQAHPQIAKIYAQGAGLAAFLLDSRQNRYHEGLVQYLAAVYAGRDDERSLSRLCGVSFGELDRQYRDFLESLP